MQEITLLIAVIALIISILAYQRTGGPAELKHELEAKASSVDLKRQIDTLVSTTDSLRDKTADALDRLEKLIRKTERGE